jgi:hypothetical protein
VVMGGVEAGLEYSTRAGAIGWRKCGIEQKGSENVDDVLLVAVHSGLN